MRCSRISMGRTIAYVILLGLIPFLCLCPKMVLCAEEEVTVSGTVSNTDITWSFFEGTLLLNGEGAMPDYKLVEDAPWHEHVADIRTVQVGDGITHLGKRNFMRLPRLQNVVLGKDVTSFAAYPFYDCPQLLRVEYNASKWPVGIVPELFYLCPKVIVVMNHCVYGKIPLAEYGIYLGAEKPCIEENITVNGTYDGNVYAIACEAFEKAKEQGARIIYSTKELTTDNFCIGTEMTPFTPAIGTKEYYYLMVYPNGVQYRKGKITCHTKPRIAYREEDLQWEYDGCARTIAITTEVATVYYSVNQELRTDNYKLVGSKVAPSITGIGEYKVYYYVEPTQNMTPESCVAGYLTVKVTKAVVTDPSTEDAVKEESSTEQSQEDVSVKEESTTKESAKLALKKDAYYSMDKKKCKVQYVNNGDGKVTFQPKKTSVAKITKNGKLTIKKPGKFTMTMKSSETDNYKAVKKKVTITIHPGKVKKPKVKLIQGTYSYFTWKKASGAKGYQIQFSTHAKYKKNTKTFYIKEASQTQCYVKGNLTGKRYRIRIRSYCVVGKKMIYGTWTKIK